jgi:hypothetical protein
MGRMFHSSILSGRKDLVSHDGIKADDNQRKLLYVRRIQKSRSAISASQATILSHTLPCQMMT